MILKVLTYPDPRLKKIAKPVKEVTPELVQLAENMLETMYDAPGVGLAAIQVGEPVRLIVIDTRPTTEDGQVLEEKMTELEKQVQYPLVLFNPEILDSSRDKKTWEEGCLSVPGYTETVERPNYVEVRAMNIRGEKIQFKADGLLAVCVQHEIDHLDGKLFLDRLTPIRRNLLKSKIKKHGYDTEVEETSKRSVI